MIIAEGDLVAFWGTYSASQTGPMGPFPATGMRMVSEMGGVHRIADGRIAETWVTWDNLTGLHQLGFDPFQT
jgi:predicted ester cyclase